jgi:hypothetical protein
MRRKNEGVPLAFVGRQAPVGAPPFGCRPQPVSQTSVFPTPNHKPRMWLVDALYIAGNCRVEADVGSQAHSFLPASLS